MHVLAGDDGHLEPVRILGVQGASIGLRQTGGRRVHGPDELEGVLILAGEHFVHGLLGHKEATGSPLKRLRRCSTARRRVHARLTLAMLESESEGE